ncbi:sensor histidine kinase [Crossiella sp. CA198]|uniref:sensor histidine kinase n=1 Tax=Crossiella sp. CA198 TaxID=3455607 RepID=UPI003F8D841F
MIGNRWLPLQVLLWLAGAAALGALGLIDLAGRAFRSGAGFGLDLGTAMTACGLALVCCWLGPRTLAVAAGVLAIGSVVLRYTGERLRLPDAPFSFAYSAAVLVLLGVLAWRGAVWWSATAALLLLGALLTQPLVADRGLAAVVGAIVLVLAAAIALGAGVTARLTARIKTRQLEHARLTQRTEFARDLHDFVAHHVTAMVVQARGALAIADRKPELVAPALERIADTGTEAMESLHRMVGLLRGEDDPARTTPIGMGELRALVARFGAVDGVRATLSESGELDELPAEVASTAHRVVLEALTNVRKHGQEVGAVDVLVQRNGQWVVVRIADDGRAPRSGGRNGFGLRGLGERAESIGGTLRSGPGAAGGWVVEARLPVGTVR